MIYKTWTDADNDGAIWNLPVYEIDVIRANLNSKQIYCTTLPEALKEFDKIKHGFLTVIDLEYGEPINTSLLKFKYQEV